jgi:adenylate cyclase
MAETRKIAAILAADVVGFSRMASADEDRTLARLRSLRAELIDPTVASQNGRVFKRTGDGALVEFRSVVEAVRCAVAIQNAMIERNVGISANQCIEFRIGIHLGDVVEESDGDLMGDGVNIAARLEGVCKPGAVCLSAAAHEIVRDRFRESFTDIGGKRLKNISRPIRVFELSASAIAKGKVDAKAGKMTVPMTASFLSKGGLAVVFLALFALFVDERPLLGLFGSVVGAGPESIRNSAMTVFFALAVVMLVVTRAEWRKMRSVRSGRGS